MSKIKFIAIVSLGVVFVCTQISLAQIPKPTKVKKPSGATVSGGIFPKSSTTTQSPRDASTGQIVSGGRNASKPMNPVNTTGAQAPKSPGYIGETEKNLGAKADQPAVTPKTSMSRSNMQGIPNPSPGTTTLGQRSKTQNIAKVGLNVSGSNIINTETNVQPKVTKMEEESSERRAVTDQKHGQKIKHPKKP